MDALQLVCQAVRSLDRHKADEIYALKIGEVSSIAEYFIIATGTSSTHIRALSDYVQEELEQQRVYPIRVEGYASASWILMDYGSVVVHLFTPQMREFYGLERLWQDGIPVPVEQLLNGSEQK